jgi:hypothetical protein
MRAALFVVLSVAVLAQAQARFTETVPRLPSGTAGDLKFILAPAGPFFVTGDPLMNGVYAFPFDGGASSSSFSGFVPSLDARENVVAAVNPSTGFIQFFRVGVEDAGLAGAGQVQTGAPALVAFHKKSASTDVLVSNGNTQITRYELVEDGGVFTGSQLTSFVLPSVPQYIAVDDRTGLLYFTTLRGIYSFDPATTQLQEYESIDAGNMGGSPFGIALYPVSDGGLILIAAIPNIAPTGESALAIFENGNFYQRFSVQPNDGGTQKVLGIKRVSVSQNAFPGFPFGVLSASDGVLGEHKLVPWNSLATIQNPPLAIETKSGSTADAGKPDAGTGDGGVKDGGMSTGTGGGTGNGFIPQPSGGRGGGSAGGGGDQPMSCGCTLSTESSILVGVLMSLLLKKRRKS